MMIFSNYLSRFSELLQTCNDLFFELDTAEVLQQSKGLYLNLDTLKHPIPYLSIFLLNILKIFIFKLTNINLNFFGIFPALNILLMYILLSKISKKFFANIFFTTIFAFSFINLTVGVFPSDYAVSLSFILCYLIFFYKKKLNLTQHRLRVCSSIILGFCSPPLLAFSLIGQIDYFNKKKFESLISLFVSIIIILFPYFIIYVFFPSKFSSVYNLVDSYSSLNNLISLKTWIITSFNFTLIPVIGFGNFIQNEYNFFNLIVSNYNKFLIFSFILIIAIKLITINEKKLNIEILIVYFLLITFFVFYAPNFNAVGIFVLPLLIIFFYRLFSDFNKILSIIFILLLLIVIYQNLFIIYNTPLDYNDFQNCKNWGVKEGFGKIIL